MLPASDETLVIATGNPGKRREFQNLLSDLLSSGWQVYDRRSFPAELEAVAETGHTYRDNALKKAVETARQTDCCCLADDSGLEVDALGGKPGVRSARFAGDGATDDDNNRLLLQKLDGIPPAERTARFVCAVALVLPDNDVARYLLDRCDVRRDEIDAGEGDRPGQFFRVDDLVAVWFRGTFEGFIGEEPKGEGGFGYDPLFVIPSLQKTAAQLSAEHKNRISHRAEAVRELLAFFDSSSE